MNEQGRMTAEQIQAEVDAERQKIESRQADLATAKRTGRDLDAEVQRIILAAADGDAAALARVAQIETEQGILASRVRRLDVELRAREAKVADLEAQAKKAAHFEMFHPTVDRRAMLAELKPRAIEWAKTVKETGRIPWSAPAEDVRIAERVLSVVDGQSTTAENAWAIVEAEELAIERRIAAVAKDTANHVPPLAVAR